MAHSDGEFEGEQRSRPVAGNGVNRSKSLKSKRGAELQRRPSALVRIRRRLSRQKDPIRFVLLGACEVGKSSVLSRIRANTFPHQYEPTFSECLCHTMLLRGRFPEMVEFLDVTGGMAAEYRPMRRRAIAQANAFILVYSVKSQASLDYLEASFEEIQEACPCLAFDDIGPKCLLLGNQANEEGIREVVAGTDTCEEALVIAPRAVSAERARTFADKWNMVAALETSALTGQGIANIEKHLRRHIGTMTMRSISVSSSTSEDDDHSRPSFLGRFRSLMRRKGPSPIQSETEAPSSPAHSTAGSRTASPAALSQRQQSGGSLQRNGDARRSYQPEKPSVTPSPDAVKQRPRARTFSFRSSFRRKRRDERAGKSPVPATPPHIVLREDAI